MAAMLVGAGSDSRMAKALERHLKRGFAARGYTAACFDSAAPALDRISDLRELEEPLAVVVADESCPGMSGLNLLREARRLHPEVRTILLCDHADLATATDAVNVGLLDHFLIKPFDGERDLLPIVSDLLESWEGARVRDAAGIRIVGERNSPRVHEIRRFLDRNGVHHTWMSPTSDAGAALLREVPEPERANPPVAVFPDGVAIGDPTNLQLASELGLATKPALDHYELAIIGGGPAGLAAAVYASSEGLTTVLLEREAPGGQAGQSARIENYLGFHAGLTGAELSRRAIIQARRFGAEIVRPTEVVGIEPLPSEQLIVKFADGSTITSNGVVISTGASYRRLTAPGVAELTGRGIHYGSSGRDPQEHVGQHVVIVGGANSAGQAALNFAGHAQQVTMLVRGDSLAKGMSQYLVDRIEKAPNVDVLTHAELAEARGSDRLESITLKRQGKPDEAPIEADAVFIYIGAVPRTDCFRGVLPADERGFLLTGSDLGPHRAAWPLQRDPFPLESVVPNVIVAGDARHGSIKRVASAVGEGSMAVQLMHQCLRTDP
jgi:thioredoxin reductase (NADPH)